MATKSRNRLKTQEGAGGADGGDEQERGQEGSNERAECGDGVNSAGCHARVRGVIHAQADGEGRDGSQQGDGDDEQHQNRHERAAQHGELKSVEGVRGGAQDRACDIWDNSQRERAPRQDAVHGKGRGICYLPSGHPANSQRSGR